MSPTRKPHDQTVAPRDADRLEKPLLSRRTAIAGAGVAGAAAAAATMMPGVAGSAGAAVASTQAADASTGYRESEHVKRYYRSARV